MPFWKKEEDRLSARLACMKVWGQLQGILFAQGAFLVILEREEEVPQCSSPAEVLTYFREQGRKIRTVLGWYLSA